MVEVADKDDNKMIFQTPIGTLKESSLEDDVIHVLVEGIVHKLFFHYYSTLKLLDPIFTIVILKRILMNRISDFSRQCKYFQLEKPRGFKIETPFQKKMATKLLKGMAKRKPPWV